MKEGGGTIVKKKKRVLYYINQRNKHILFFFLTFKTGSTNNSTREGATGAWISPPKIKTQGHDIN